MFNFSDYPKNREQKYREKTGTTTLSKLVLTIPTNHSYIK
jgi:hypothetical protein